MPYIVNFSNKENKPSITVYDNTSSYDTSLVFPGRNVTGYGQIIGENFLHLLENFAHDQDNPPVNPVEGQLWFDTTNKLLKIYDGNTWRPANNIQRSNVQPSVDAASVGELWVDTINQQLYIFSGERWILVGPTFSTGLRSGPIVEQIIDSDNIARVVVTFYVEDSPVIIISKDSFTPKSTILGFSFIKTGANISSVSDLGYGDFSPKFYGSSTSADALNVGTVEVEASKFLRSDIVNTTEYGFIVRNNSGMTIGIDGNFILSNSTGAAKIYNSSAGSSIDLQVNLDGVPNTVLRVVDGKVGINKAVPDEDLHVSGNVKIDSALIISSTTESTSFDNGSIRTAGGVAVAKNLKVGTTLSVDGKTTSIDIVPKLNDTYNLGDVNSRWNVVRAKTIVADILEADLSGSITGNSGTATAFQNPVALRIEGDVYANPRTLTGTEGSIVFSTQLTSTIISSKTSAPATKRPKDRNDQILTYRDSPSEVGGSIGLFKQSKTDFIADFGVPIGAILPYAGENAPDGYLLCDGSEVERTKYQQLYDVLGSKYGIPSIGANTFKLPDLRGRFPLGRDNMDNGIAVPTGLGGYADGGGGNVDRVPGTAADSVGGSGGNYSNTLVLSNLPDHEHNMKGSTGQQYYASRIDTAVPTDTGAFSDKGPTSVGQSQYVPTSGGVKTASTLGEPFSVMNPYLTINYIIRSGPPEF